MPELPVKAQCARPRKEDNISQSVLHILIVEDNFAAAQTTGWLVEGMGHTYALADRAEAAITGAQQHTPDVVLLDIGLPGIHGFDLCRQMKALPALADTVFIAHSGYGEQRYRDRAAEVGFAHYLLKPFQPAQLESLLDAISRRRPAST